MEVVTKIREWLSSWTKGGESECHSFLYTLHCNPSGPKCADVLTTSYHTLLCSALHTWSPKNPLSPTAFVEFVQSVLRSLPSSSSSPSSSSRAEIFGETLVDLIWSIDSELEELLGDIKATLTTCEDQGNQPNASVAIVLFKTRKARQDAESDKDTIQFIVKKLLGAGVINPYICRERLDATVLAGVGLISDRASMEKKEVRTRTGLFYKQNKFNLLREQSEGYSKLTAELTSSLGPSHSAVTGRPIESYLAIARRAQPVWEKVISLIGYFDLDPNKALDIILDVLSVHLSTHFSFFLALLSFSPWSGAYRLPATANDDDMIANPSFCFRKEETILSLADGKKFQDVLPSTATGSPRVLAQVLGFKFAYYQSSEVMELTPRNLYLIGAILIREGFITLEDLYPHLSPEDQDMEALRKDYVENVQSRIAGAKTSQLAMAAPLESSSSSKVKTGIVLDVKKGSDAKDRNQKLGFLTALLTVGALRPAFFMLSRFPWLIDVQPEIADLMIRIMKVSISRLYDSLLVVKERNPSFTQCRARFGASGVIPAPARRHVLTLCAPTPPSTSTIEFSFFFPDWDQQVSICNSLDDLKDEMEPLLRYTGIHISRDPLFLTKFLRLGRLHLQSMASINPVTNMENPIRSFWFKILRAFLLPALPLIRGNAVCTVEVWNIIRQYETTARWQLYGEWKTAMYKSHPELRIRQVQADRESKGILRRLAHNTIDSLSGTVAKLAHSNPCIFFTNAVNQIMAYDNLANVVIQGLRYVTNMGFDVLVFIILDALANPHKDRLKDDGVNTTDWLQSLASFTGMLFRRYSADLSPVLKYVVHQLHSGQTTELVVLRELIWKMAGIEPLPSLSDAQVAAMAGGPVLRIESVASSTRGARLDPGDAVLKGPQRLGKCLIESALALPLLIQVAQQRQACVFRAPDTHLKSLASLYDMTHGVLLQYLELLTSPSVIPPQDYATKVLPTIGELGIVYGICAPICMQIIRPVLHELLLKLALAAPNQEQIANEEAEKRLKAALTAKREPTTVPRMASPGLSNPAVTDVSADSKRCPDSATLVTEDIAMELDQNGTGITSIQESPWLPELSALFDDIKKIAPGNAYDVIGPGFYVTFWQLSTYDLSPPSAKYDEEGAALLALSRQEDVKSHAADRSGDRSRRSAASSHRTRRERYLNTAVQLTQELKEQTASRAFTLKRLAREKHHWFSHSSKALTLVGSIIEHCLQPRSLLSPMDADFCAQFIKVLHTQGTPGFHTLMCYDKLLGDHVKVVLFSCSEYEAHNYGRFLLGILSDLYKWHLDEQLYLADNRIKIGGRTVYHPGMQRSWTNKLTSPDTLLDWIGLQKILKKWHRKLSKCFVDCIQTGEFMHVYNAIIVMKELLPVFPLAAVADTGSIIDTAMDRFLETEERGDLKILGRAYSAGLKKRESLWLLPASKHKPPTTSSPKTSASDRQNDKMRGSLQSGVNSQTYVAGDGRRGAITAAVNPPSGPRAQLSSGHSIAEKALGNSLDSAKLAMDSIPRPEVVKRIRTDNKDSQSPKMPADVVLPHFDPVKSSLPSNIQDIRNDDTVMNGDSPQPSIQESLSLRGHRPEEKVRLDVVPTMPPPSVPSQTPSAQELRETAKQSMIKSEKIDASRSATVSPRVRSPSPISRPGTRDASLESRGSGGRSRPDRVGMEVDRDDRRSERESRSDQRDHAVLNRRDSLTHNRERGGRDRPATGDRENDRDRERDRGRERHGDREKERDRDRETERIRDRERDREREKEKERDRHRRDDRDRDRDGRKERDLLRSQIVLAPLQDDRGALSSRQDSGRHRSVQGDDGLGKRRRITDDDPERTSKRSSRRDGHRDDRGRRTSDKEGHERPRDSERRRKEREESDESRLQPLSSDKLGDKRFTSDTISPTSSKIQPPIAPRAMAAGDTTRAGKETTVPGRDHYRDQYTGNLGSVTTSTVPLSHSEGSQLSSLQSRIGAKETLRSSSQVASHTLRSDGHKKDEDRESRKRATTDVIDPGMNLLNDSGQVPSKRPRLVRNRYPNPPPSHGPNHAFARKVLPVDPSAGDKSRGRKD